MRGLGEIAFGVALLWAGAAQAGEVDGLRAKLADADEAQAEEAARKLGESKEPAALDAILGELSIGAPPKVQAALLGALAGRSDARSVAMLKVYARNRNPELRKKAVVALGGLPDPQVVPALLDALSDPAPDVRAAAATALGKRKERSAEAKLIKLLSRKDAAAPPALAALGTPELAHRLAELVGQVPDDLLCTALGDMLKRPDFGPDPIRREVVKALSKIPGIDSTTALIEYVAATEKDPKRPSRLEAQKIVDERSAQ